MTGSRLIVVAGDRDSRGLALATVESLRGEGLDARLVDARDVSHRGAAVEAARPWARLLVELGADGLAESEWGAVPGFSEIATLLRAWEVAADADAVVLDAGDLARLRDLVRAPSGALRLLDAALTPRLAMWRTPEDLAEGADGDAAEPLFDVLSRARASLVRLVRMVESPQTSVRLCVEPDSTSTRAVARTWAMLAMLGVRVDGVLLHPYPDASDRKDRRRADRIRDRLQRRVRPTPVWTSRRRYRPAPKKSAVADLHGSPVPLGDVSLEVDGLTVRVPLVGDALREARIGMQGPDLVVELDGVLRRVALPAVLQRCLPVDAVRGPAGLTVTFTPDRRVWPADGSDDAGEAA